MSEKLYNNQKALFDFVTTEYVLDRQYTNKDELLHSLDLLCDNNMGIMIHDAEFIMPKTIAFSQYVSWYMCRINKKLTECLRDVSEYKCGGTVDMNDVHLPDRLKEIDNYKVLQNGVFIGMPKSEDADYVVSVVTWYLHGKIDIKVYFIGEGSQKLLNKFIKKWKKYTKEYYDYLRQYQFIDKSYLQYSDSSIKKPTIFKSFDDMIFHQKNDIINKIDRFIETIPKYEQYHIVPKLSILLYGKPGTGKSTFYKALAKYLNINNVYILRPSFFTNHHVVRRNDDNDSEFVDDYYGDNNDNANGGEEGPIIAIDDIDAICNSRDDDRSKDNNSTISYLLEYLDNPDTFYYKSKDGRYHEIAIIVATTNYYDRLDEAVKRFGRFDITIEMQYFNLEESREFAKMYDLNLEDIITDKPLDETFSISPAELQVICMQNIELNLKREVLQND